MGFRLEAPPQPGDYELELRVAQAVDGQRGVVGPDALRLPVRVRARRADVTPGAPARAPGTP